jgi:MFS family permease
MCAVISALGPEAIVVPALMLPVAMELAKMEEIPDLLMATLVIAGSLAGGLSPLTPSGIIANSLAAQQGMDTTMTVLISMFAAGTLMGAVYYVLFGGLKLKGTAKQQDDNRKFDVKQKITMTIIGVVIGGILFLNWDIGLTAFTGVALLLLLKAANQNEAFLAIPWSTLMLVSGVAVLVNVVSIAGGIATLSKFLAGIMNATTAAPIMAMMGGLMSAVSSASGVVMPTLIPTVPGIVQHMGGSVSASSLVSAIVVGAHVVTLIRSRHWRVSRCFIDGPNRQKQIFYSVINYRHEWHSTCFPIRAAGHLPVVWAGRFLTGQYPDEIAENRFCVTARKPALSLLLQNPAE